MNVHAGRNGWGGWLGCAAIASILVVVGAARAQNPADAQKPGAASKGKEETSATDRGKSCALEVTVIRIKLNEKHAFGSGLSTKDLEAMVAKDNKIPAVCESLKKYGDISVAFQLESAAVLGGRTRVSSGSQTPVVSASGGSGEGKTASPPTFSTSYVSSGLDAGVALNPSAPGMVTLNYDLNLNDSIPVELKNPLPGETQPVKLVKQQRLQWQGDCTVPINRGVFAAKSLKTDDGMAIEYFVVLQISPTDGSE